MLKTLLADTRKILKLYGLGALCFFVGMGIIQWADGMLSPSLYQELMMLIGVGVAGFGFITAMAAQCLLIVQRFQNMGAKK